MVTTSSNKQLLPEKRTLGKLTSSVAFLKDAPNWLTSCWLSSRDVILDSVTKRNGEDSLLSLSKHKYASNVVEKLIQHGSSLQRERIVNELLNVSVECPLPMIGYHSPPHKKASASIEQY